VIQFPILQNTDPLLPEPKKKQYTNIKVNIMIRVHKSKADQNKFLQLFLNEFNLTIAFSIITGLPILFFAPIPIQAKSIIIAMVTVTFGLIFYQKIDGKPLTQFAFSGLKYIFSSKQYSKSQLANMSNFYYSIKNDLVFTTSTALAVIQILPIDISILNEQGKEGFKKYMASFLHTLGDNDTIQIRIVNRLATTADYKAHFDNLLNNSRQNNANPTVIKMVNNYITHLTDKIETQNVPFKDYYLIIPTWIGSKPNPDTLKEYLKSHERTVANLCDILNKNQMETIRLENHQLEQFYKESIVNYN
jgi:hypothetical protein